VKNNCNVFKDTIVVVHYLMLATDPAVPIANETREAVYVKRNIVARWCKHFAVEKQGVLHIPSLNYPAGKAHAPQYIAIYGLSGCTIFFYFIS